MHQKVVCQLRLKQDEEAEAAATHYPVTLCFQPGKLAGSPVFPQAATIDSGLPCLCPSKAMFSARALRLPGTQDPPKLGFQAGKLADSHSTLFKMRKHDTGTCEFCGHEETSQHVMLFCLCSSGVNVFFALRSRADHF